MTFGQDHISVNGRLSFLARVEDEATKSPSVVQNPYVQSNPTEG